MQIYINGEHQTIADNTTITQLLEQLAVEDKIVAVSLNANVVKKDTWTQVYLREHDRLELLQFMSGG
ncbi:sulfur carrier protein ThiS [Helicobacter trogontum]|uniref:Sulfur carrier protein ThiS n=1 Tax=Helicobacter trogontum TaxID=50960 RepID=A0A4U8TEG1_9HELI|nr:sulfur carrier protein ThiS [Helicobacter trogontum]MCI5787593.1 sulfur carrier protein ThiS [Helicobacter trogontum]MDY5184993.1 sulfur carrier protein ThiS [Helicobacter trogontum]TLD98430.1 sulfur carrier protein ThiS [Helicobacter trogontum]